MEKFGYLVCDSCSPGEFLYIHPSLFLNIIDCVQNVVLRKDISDKRIVYFKILNNSEIVQYIHNDAQEECFGFCQLHQTDPNDKFKVFSPNKHLFVNLLDCVLEARDITSDEDLSPPSSGSHEVKIPPYNVYLGKGAAIELKEFRKSYYIAFSKTVDGEIRNRSHHFLLLSHLRNARQGKPSTEGSKHDMTGKYEKARETRRTTNGTNRAAERRPVRSKQATAMRHCPYYLRSRVKQAEGISEDRRSIGIESVPQNNIRRRSLSMEALDGDPVDRSE
ncbi:uncharacterized protein TNCV_3794581 [Trichonephila clavipes]|nr:uncharacterized protein TNCV_3794581 [Trichonephila clavipes]